MNQVLPDLYYLEQFIDFVLLGLIEHARYAIFYAILLKCTFKSPILIQR